MLTQVTDNIIEELIVSSYGGAPDARSRHLLEHALHNLVRAAKAEQLHQMKRDVSLAIGERMPSA